MLNCHRVMQQRKGEQMTGRSALTTLVIGRAGQRRELRDGTGGHHRRDDALGATDAPAPSLLRRVRFHRLRVDRGTVYLGDGLGEPVRAGPLESAVMTPRALLGVHVTEAERPDRADLA